MRRSLLRGDRGREARIIDDSILALEERIVQSRAHSWTALGIHSASLVGLIETALGSEATEAMLARRIAQAIADPP